MPHSQSVGRTQCTERILRNREVNGEPCYSKGTLYHYTWQKGLKMSVAKRKKLRVMKAS